MYITASFPSPLVLWVDTIIQNTITADIHSFFNGLCEYLELDSVIWKNPRRLAIVDSLIHEHKEGIAIPR